MPYIKQEDRELYRPYLNYIILAMAPSKESPINTVLFGAFVDQILESFIGAKYKVLYPRYDSTFSEILEISTIINTKNEEDAAGHINYVISSVYWSLISDGKYCKSAKYGMRAFLNGIICTISHTLMNVDPDLGNWKKLFICSGVLDHIRHETYIRCTTPYEEIKIAENRPIITNGELS